MQSKRLSYGFRKWQAWALGIISLLLIAFHTPILLITSSASAYWGNYQSTSLVQIISSPWIYHGRNVEVMGYFRFEFERQKLYLNKDDYQYDMPNAIWISLGGDYRTKKDVLDSKYVLIRGKFDATYRGRANHLTGGIRSIQAIEPIEPGRGDT
jgi:hypothetical protein